MEKEKKFNWKGNIKVYMIANAKIGEDVYFAKGETYSVNEDCFETIKKSCMLEKDYLAYKKKALNSKAYSTK